MDSHDTLTLLIIFNMFCSAASDINKTTSIVIQRFQYLLTNRQYDFRLPPLLNTKNATQKTIPVDISIFVNAIGEIDEVNMEFLINIYMRHLWKDERLAYATDIPDVDVISLPDDMIARMWIPDTFIENGKQESKHNVPVPNHSYRISPDGTVFSSQRLSLRLWCLVYLYYFPMDDQSCQLRMMSYRYTEAEMKLQWLANSSIESKSDIAMAKFTLETIQTGDCTTKFSTAGGAYSCLNATFLFRREFGYYFIQIYIPSALIVVLSWVSFWLDAFAVPGRISLGVLTVLTMSTQMSAAGSALPKVSYIKAIDVWLTTCMCFLFAALVEFAVVNSLARRKRSEKEVVMSLQAPNAEDEQIHASKVVSQGDIPTTQNGTTHYRGKLYATNMGKHAINQTDTVRSTSCTVSSTKVHFEFKGSYIDKISRIAFPFLFIIFNVVYWFAYSRVHR